MSQPGSQILEVVVRSFMMYKAQPEMCNVQSPNANYVESTSCSPDLYKFSCFVYRTMPIYASKSNTKQAKDSTYILVFTLLIPFGQKTFGLGSVADCLVTGINSSTALNMRPRSDNHPILVDDVDVASHWNAFVSIDLD